MGITVSIIIPTFNRSHILGETLNSILCQTFSDWECIVVDDGSEDYTPELMKFYCTRDKRISYYKRPDSTPKGANACRNYGFELSKGGYIQWFDSDDLMVPEFLEEKVNILEKNDVDYVISLAASFKDPDYKEIISRHKNYYKFSAFEISNYNYVSQNINWLTYDFMGRREICNYTRFNESLSSGQEYNFFSKLTYYTTSAIVVPKYLTLRRIHSNSIRSSKTKKDRIIAELETWKDICKIDFKIPSENYLLLKLLKVNERELPASDIFRIIIINLINQKRFKTAWFAFIYSLYNFITGKGEYFRTMFMRTLKYR